MGKSLPETCWADHWRSIKLLLLHLVGFYFTLITKIFTSYTTINIKIHTIKCYKFLMATCFGRPCDHHQANFNRSWAFIVLTIWDPIMCTSFFIYGPKSLLKVFTVIYKKYAYVFPWGSCSKMTFMKIINIHFAMLWNLFRSAH